MNKLIGRLLVACLAAFSLVSGCTCSDPIDPDDAKYDNILILWSNGYNNLRNYLSSDIEDIQSSDSYLPSKSDKDVFLIVSHLAVTKGDYSTPVSPQLIRVYRDSKTKKAVMDTLKSYSSDCKLGQAATMKSILNEIHSQFNAEHWGMVFSSHSTGWLPKGYYSAPERYDSKNSGASVMDMEYIPEGAVPYREEPKLPGEPDVKSLSSTMVSSGGSVVSYEIDLPDFVDAFPFHFDYVIIDACLAGGVEVAYQMKSVTDKICFSQAEVLAEGLVYKQVAGHLLYEDQDVEAVAKDYYDHYESVTDKNGRAATMSVVDCTKLDALTGVCKELFSKYRTEIAELNSADVQRYYRSSHHWYYDLEDILLKAGITTSEKTELEAALNQCITFKAATEAFMPSLGGFTIDMYSGLSMYLPCDGSDYLDKFYKTLEWNKATELVD